MTLFGTPATDAFFVFGSFPPNPISIDTFSPISESGPISADFVQRNVLRQLISSSTFGRYMKGRRVSISLAISATNGCHRKPVSSIISQVSTPTKSPIDATIVTHHFERELNSRRIVWSTWMRNRSSVKFAKRDSNGKAS